MDRIKTMTHGQISGRWILVLCVGTSLLFTGGSALADGHGANAAHHMANVRHSNHYYHNGRWYRHGWFGVGIAEPVLSTGVYVSTLPAVYTPVVIQGNTYYYGDNTYFSPSSDGGYTVVSRPSGVNPM